MDSASKLSRELLVESFLLFALLFFMKERYIILTTVYREELEAVAQRCSVKKVFLEISQNSQENTCARIFF